MSEPSQNQKNLPDKPKLLDHRIISYIIDNCFKPLNSGVCYSAELILILVSIWNRISMCLFFFSSKSERKEKEVGGFAAQFLPSKAIFLGQQNSRGKEGFLLFSPSSHNAFLFCCAEVDAWTSLHVSFLCKWGFVIFFFFWCTGRLYHEHTNPKWTASAWGTWATRPQSKSFITRHHHPVKTDYLQLLIQ